MGTRVAVTPAVRCEGYPNLTIRGTHQSLTTTLAENVVCWIGKNCKKNKIITILENHTVVANKKKVGPHTCLSRLYITVVMSVLRLIWFLKRMLVMLLLFCDLDMEALTMWMPRCRFWRACTLVQKSYCYIPPVSASASASESTYKMLGQMLKSWNFSLSVFFVAFNYCLLYLLLRTPGTVPFGTCICSHVEAILS